MKHFTGWFLLTLLVPMAASAQDVPRASVRTSRTHVVTGTVGGEQVDYRIVVSVPPDYDATSERYPVVFYTDAWYVAGGVEETYHWLRAFRDIPPLILVGVSWQTDGAGAYRNRARDLTPSLDTINHPELRNAGGASDFFRFLHDRLIPFVDSQYRTVPSPRGLMGYSLGGLFASWVLLNHPGTFNRYLLGSPYVRWDNWLVLRQEAEYAAGHDSLAARVYSCSGTDDFVLPDFAKLRERLESRKYAGFEYTAEVFPGESHTSAIPGCYSRAFRALYGKLKPVHAVAAAARSTP